MLSNGEIKLQDNVVDKHTAEEDCKVATLHEMEGDGMITPVSHHDRVSVEYEESREEEQNEEEGSGNFQDE